MGFQPVKANVLSFAFDVQLKKVIKRVANELSELGLTSEVLKDLLENGQEAVPPPALSELSLIEAAKVVEVTRGGVSSGRTTPTSASPARAGALNGHAKADGDSSEDEDEAEAFIDGLKKDFNGIKAAKAKERRKRRAHATYEFAGTSSFVPTPSHCSPGEHFANMRLLICSIGTHEHPEPRIRIVFSSASSESVSDDSNGLLDSQSSDTSTLSELTPSSRGITRDNSPYLHHRITELNSSESEAGSPRPGSGTDKDDTSSTNNDDGELEFEGAGPQANSLLRKMYGHKPTSDEDDEEPSHNWSEVDVEVEPKRRNSDETLRSEDLGLAGLRLADAEAEAEGTRRDKQAVVDSITSSDGVEADDEAGPSLRPRR